jgi:hypothetical protein
MSEHMSDELEELKERIARHSDEELIEMVTVGSGDYREEALNYARAELQNRGVNWSEAADSETANEGPPPETRQVSEQMETTDSRPGSGCTMCGGSMRVGTLVAEKELTIIFDDNHEERFVRVTACVRCGQVSLIVDYEAEVQQ